MRPARRALRGVSLVATGAVLTAAMLSCSNSTPARGDAVAAWVRSQPHVIDAEAHVDGLLGGNHGMTVPATVDDAISDDELSALMRGADHRAEDEGWPNPLIIIAVGSRGSVSNLGGPVTTLVFNALRHDARYEFVSARGEHACSSNFCVTLPTDDPGALLSEVKHMLAVADDAGGVQQNLDFAASSSDGEFSVQAQPDAPVDDAVALWQLIAMEYPLDSAYAHTIEPVGDIPASESLTLTVDSAERRAAVEQRVSIQARVEVRVFVTGDQ